MRYVSTRSDPASSAASGGASFSDVLLQGLAPDGGLFVPVQMPALPQMARPEGSDEPGGAPPRDYTSVATKMMAPFIGDAIGAEVLNEIVADAYSSFTHPDICPLVQLKEDHWLLELFHGPTFAFKDVALQVVARLIDFELHRRGERAMIIVATSGDTGSAAMEAVAGRDRIDIVVLHPSGRTSEVQRRQMTTLEAPNVHAVAVDGTFDDCQDLVKAMFADETFRRDMQLSALNSINWARVMAQIVYYVWASQQLGTDQPITFCVPTGNFGNVLSGHYARRMGLDIKRLLIASNTNDILIRLIETGDLTAHQVVATLSPSMDIQISSNLERLLFEFNEGDGAATADLLARFRSRQSASLKPDQHRRLRSQFTGDRLNDAQTVEVMGRVHAATGILIDPHTAVGVGVAQRCREPSETTVTLATAHPAKFPEAVRRAIGDDPPVPESLAAVWDRPERCAELPNSLKEIKDFIRSKCRN